MDDIVKQAMAKWPNVPHCFGWLGLDTRGDWYMRDDRTQQLGGFTSGVAGAKGSRLVHDKLIAFIHRNYAADDVGQWFFQNGPQRVYLELAAAPYIWRIQSNAELHDFAVSSHTGQTVQHIQSCWLDELGRVFLQTDIGFGLVHTQDVGLAAQAMEYSAQRSIWQPRTARSIELATKFGFVLSPQTRHQAD